MAHARRHKGTALVWLKRHLTRLAPDVPDKPGPSSTPSVATSSASRVNAGLRRARRRDALGRQLRRGPRHRLYSDNCTARSLACRPFDAHQLQVPAPKILEGGPMVFALGQGVRPAVGARHRARAPVPQRPPGGGDPPHTEYVGCDRLSSTAKTTRHGPGTKSAWSAA